MCNTKRKVLVVDDQADMTKIISETLESGGFDTIVANNGTDAIGVAQKEKPDLVLIDFNMPEVNGLRVVIHMRGNDENNETPIIMMTAGGPGVDKALNPEACQKNRISAVIRKPTAKRTLLGIIREVIGVGHETPDECISGPEKDMPELASLEKPSEYSGYNEMVLITLKTKNCSCCYTRWWLIYGRLLYAAMWKKSQRRKQ